MDPRRLRLLLELSRLGSMRAVAETMHLTTSSVSQQIAALTREAGTPLLEPEGRRVRLTPAGLRLADHAVTVLAALDAARADLDPEAEPSGTLRVGGFATAIRRSLLPVIAEVAGSHPDVHVSVQEYEPLEALDLLVADRLDLALVYDYNLAPVALRPEIAARHLWDVPWGLGVPDDLPPNRPPSAGLQFFGLLEVEPRTRVLTVSLVNTAGTRVFSTELRPSEG